MALPEGTVTFLRSDIEGSMEHVRALGARYDELNAEHAALIRAAVEAHAGHVVRTEGDAFFVVFTDATAAARAAVDAQRAMVAHAWPDDHPLKVRMGIHSGVATRAGDDYGGFEVNRAARVAAVGAGGQIVLSDPARALIATDLPADWTLEDLGRYRLKGVVGTERLYQLTASGLQADFPDPRERVDASDHLPAPGGIFIGREAELEALERLCQEARLLTLTGPGGTGKTTLVLELARRHADTVEDGTWFVDLQAVRDPARVRGEIARAVGLFDSPAGAAADRLTAYLADREVLIVLDNFEQVVDAAPLVSELLEASPRSRLLVTSRVPLRLRDEQEYPVRPLRTEGTEDEPAEAVRLFAERVRRLRPDTALETELADIVAICRLLDGLPLAIELAAARTSVLPIGVIRSRLEQRLPLPGSGPRDLPERQQTMEATVAWSYELLDPTLQRLLRRAAVFSGPFELEQAEQVLGPDSDPDADVLSGLFELTERSLLARVEDAVGGVRFGMLETIKAYAAARLAESAEEETIRARHASAFSDLARREYADAFLPGRPESLDRLDADVANLRAATKHAIEHDLATEALTLIGHLWRYWLGVGRLREATEWAEPALARADGRVDDATLAFGHDAAGSLCWWSGDIEGTGRHYHRQLETAERSGRKDLIGAAWFNLAYLRGVSGDGDGAIAAMDEAERRFEELGNERWLARILQARIFAVSPEVGADERKPISQDVVERLSGVDDAWARASALMAASEIALGEGDNAGALRAAAEGFRLLISFRDYGNVVVALLPVGVSLLRSDPDNAARMIGASEGASERFGIVSPPSVSELTGMDEPTQAFEEVLGSDRYHELVAEGRRLTIDQAVELLELSATSAGD